MAAEDAIARIERTGNEFAQAVKDGCVRDGLRVEFWPLTQTGFGDLPFKIKVISPERK